MISALKTAAILRDLDIEGLLSLGAPEDEYDSEAAQVAASLPPTEAPTAAAVFSVLEKLWDRRFGPFTREQLRLREPALAEAAARIAACDVPVKHS